MKKIDRALGRTLVVATIAAGLAWFARGIKESFWRTDQSLHIRWNITNFSDQYERICKLDNESLCHAYVTDFCHEACTLLNYNCKLSPNTSNRVERYYLDWDERIDRNAEVEKALKRLEVESFACKAGESLTEVVGRLYAIVKEGLPGLSESRNGIRIVLQMQGGSRDEPLTLGFSVRDMSFYGVLETFCVASDYRFEIDGDVVKIFPSRAPIGGQAVIDYESPALKEAILCGHGSVADEERELLHQLQAQILPAISIGPPATRNDVVEFLRFTSAPVGEQEKAIDICVETVTADFMLQPISELLSAKDISLYDAIKLVADCSGFRMEIRGRQVVLSERFGGCRLCRIRFGGRE